MKLAVAFVLTSVVAGCGALDGPVVIRTRGEPDDICLQARVGGTLVEDPAYGLAFQNEGDRQGVVWPYGFSAQRESGVVVLVGPGGTVVAREGDRIHAGGGGAGDNSVGAYCEIQVNASPEATIEHPPFQLTGLRP